MTISIVGRLVGSAHPPFIIAEMSGNHNGSLARAKAIIEAMAEAGADAVKIQTYTADTMTIRSDKPGFRIEDKKSLWAGRTLYDLYEEAHTPWEWHEELFAHAKACGILMFSTPFDASAVAFLQKLNAPLFKIASFENTDIPLIREVAKTGKPMIVSSGTASLVEIKQAVDAARLAGAKDIVVLKCTSSYPAPASESNLRAMETLARELNVPVGLSDHTLGIGTAIAAVALGACVIEKHVTLSRAEGGVDSAFSLEPAEVKLLVSESRAAWESLGSSEFAPSESEKASRVFRRSLYVVKDMKQGEAFTRENVRAIRPGYGLPPVEIDAILAGGKAARDLEAGTPLAQELIRY